MVKITKHDTLNHSGMKRIALWKMLLLSLVTLGVYQIVWLFKRRNELTKKYDQPIPGWQWLVLPGVVVVGVLALGLLVGVFTGHVMLVLYITTLVVAMLQPILFAIFVLWIWQFSKATAYVTNNRLPAPWSLVLLLIVGNCFVLFAQYYFNRASSPQALLGKEKTGPSRLFATLATTAVVTVIIIPVIAATVLLPYFTRISNTSNRLTFLQQQYITCQSRLQNKYTTPVVDQKDQAEYLLEYYLCDDVNVEAHKTQELLTKQLTSLFNAPAAVLDPDGHELRLRINQVFVKIDPMGIAAQEASYFIGAYEELARDTMWVFYQADDKNDFTVRTIKTFKDWLVDSVVVSPRQVELITKAAEEIYNDPHYSTQIINQPMLNTPNEQYEYPGFDPDVPDVNQQQSHPELSGAEDIKVSR